MAEVLDWPRDNPTEVAVRAAQHLRAGNLLVIPTDSAYALLAHGESAAAVARLAELSGEAPTVALAVPADVKNWLPNLGALGWRLARNSWPGPLTLQSPAETAAEVWQKLPGEVPGLVLREGLLSLRCPAHAVLSHIGPVLEGPLFLAELPEATRVEEALARINDDSVLIINDGPTYFGRCSTMVRVEGKTWTETRSGVLTAEVLADLALCRILFLCTGNTCRSPLAMALCRQLLAQRLGCTIGELPQRGFQVLSAGLAAIMGQEASPEAVEIVREMGGELQEHRSQPLTVDLLAQADCLFTMTAGHLRMLQSLQDLPGPEPCLLSPGGQDVSDPIGLDVEVYRHCARQILGYLEARLPQLLEL